MDTLLLNSIVSKPSHLLVLLIALILFFHFIFVWPRNLSTKQWKFIDYIWLCITTLGLISLTTAARKEIASNWLFIEKEKACFAYEHLQLTAKQPTNWICMKFQKSKESPNNLPELQAEYDQACLWFQEAYNRLPMYDSINPPPISIDSFPSPQITDSLLLLFQRDFINAVKYYNIQKQSYDTATARSRNSNSDIIFLYLSPILFCISIALRFSKISGELRNLKQQTIQ